MRRISELADAWEGRKHAWGIEDEEKGGRAGKGELRVNSGGRKGTAGGNKEMQG
jgi:hypothetical protein